MVATPLIHYMQVLDPRIRPCNPIVSNWKINEALFPCSHVYTRMIVFERIAAVVSAAMPANRYIVAVWPAYYLSLCNLTKNIRTACIVSTTITNRCEMPR